MPSNPPTPDDIQVVVLTATPSKQPSAADSISAAPTTSDINDEDASGEDNAESPKEDESLLSDDYFITNWYYLVIVAAMFLFVAAVLMWCIRRNNRIIEEEERKGTVKATTDAVLHGIANAFAGGDEEAIVGSRPKCTTKQAVQAREFNKVHSISPTPSPRLAPRMPSTNMAGMSLTIEHAHDVNVQMGLMRPQSLVVGSLSGVCIETCEEDEGDDDDLYTMKKGSVDTRGAGQTIGGDGVYDEAADESDEGSEDRDRSDEDRHVQQNGNGITPQ